MSDRKTTDPWVNIATWYLRQMASRISYFSVFNVLVTFEFGIFTKTLFRKNFDQIKKINAGKTSYEISVLSSNWIFFLHTQYLSKYLLHFSKYSNASRNTSQLLHFTLFLIQNLIHFISIKMLTKYFASNLEKISYLNLRTMFLTIAFRILFF